MIIPSRNLVVVRLGLTQKYDGTWDLEDFIEQLFEALPVNAEASSSVWSE